MTMLYVMPTLTPPPLKKTKKEILIKIFEVALEAD